MPSRWHPPRALASTAVLFFIRLIPTLSTDGINSLFSVQSELSQVILNPTHEIIYQSGKEETSSTAEDELIYAYTDQYFIKTVLTFDLTYAPLDSAELERASNATLRVYLLNGNPNRIIFDVDGVDKPPGQISIETSSCVVLSSCWLEVDLRTAMSWSINNSAQPSQLKIGISTNEQLNGALAASAFRGGQFAPELILDFDQPAQRTVDYTRTVKLKGSNGTLDKKEKKKQKLKMMLNKKKQQKKDKKDKKKKGKKDEKPGKKNKPKKNNGGKKPGKPKPPKNNSLKTNKPQPKPAPSPTPPEKPTVPSSLTAAASTTLEILRSKEAVIIENLLLYDDPTLGKIQSVYTFDGLVRGLLVMGSKGVAGHTFYLGNDDKSKGSLYGLVNIAAFLAQSLKETIKYNACDENSWDLVDGKYPLSNACGQLGQSYQDYHCPASEKHMECPVDPNMEITAVTHATWYGAPGPLYCKPKANEKDFTGYWDYQFDCNNPWADPPITCEVYENQKAGKYDNTIPVANTAGRTDVEGCCWWGRGVIQTTGICNFGKLNYYLGARASKEGRDSPYPDVDFCKNPEAICSSQKHKELKWIAGMFYWMESLQQYDSKGWRYMEQLHAFVDGGLTDPSFINAVSGIVNRGCHDPPCGTGEVDGLLERSYYFSTVMSLLNAR